MVELGALFANLKVMGGYSSVQSSSGKPSSSDSDVFSTLFQRASDNYQSKQSTKNVGAGKDPVSAKQPVKEELPSDDDLSEDMAALMGSSIIQETQVENPADQTEQQVSVQTDQQAVISILEGNMDIGAQQAAADDVQQIPAEAQAEEAVQKSAGEELTARMPQETGQVQIHNTAQAETKEVEGAESAENEGPCPLENKNDSAASGSARGSQEDKSEDSDKNDNSSLYGMLSKVDISADRLAGSERLSSAAETVPTTATVETLYDTMVESIAMSSANESTYMEIQLKPDFMGKVAIQLALSDEGVEIRIKAEDMAVKSLIAGQISQLTESLMDKGIKVTTVDVVYTPDTENSFEHSNNGEEQQANHTYNGTAAESVNLGFGIGFTEDADEVSVLDTGISSVEYRA